MAKLTVIITDKIKYKELTGISIKKGETADHTSQEITLLLTDNCITIPPLTLKILEFSKKKILKTSDEQGSETPEDILATRLTVNTDFPAVCRKAVKKIGIHYDKSKYWWIWNEKEYRWQETDDTTILNKIDSKLTDSTNTIENGIKSLLIEALKREGRLNTPETLDWHWIQFKDKLINFKTDESMEASSKYFITNPIPWNLGESTETPMLDKLLKDWINKKGPEHDLNILKDLFAFVLPPKYFIASVPFLYGNGGDGKSQFENLMEKFIGEDNHTSTTLSYLEKSNFGTYSLRKNLVSFISEVPNNEIDQFTTIKTISGGTKCYIEKKGHQRTKEHVYAKIFLVGNDVPICKDTSDGFTRRIHPIEFPNRYKQGADIFESIPDKEFENLAAWCLQRLKELTKSYILTGDSADVDEKALMYKRLSNPIIKFMEDKKYQRTSDITDYILISELMNEFNAWAIDNNKRMMDHKEFRAKATNLGLQVETRNIMIDNDKTRRVCIEGIKKVIPIPAEDNTLQETLK